VNILRSTQTDERPAAAAELDRGIALTLDPEAQTANPEQDRADWIDPSGRANDVR